jgi:polyhydroxyalkanoate synthesis regulator phasin
VISTLGGLKIDHVTEYQSFHKWHVGRKFSSSSKGVATQVPIQLKLDKERDERHGNWVVLEKYLAINGGIVESESETNTTEANAEDASTSEDEMEQTSQESETVVESGTLVDEETRTCVEEMIRDATDMTERNVAYCKTLADELKAGGHKDILEELVNQMGGKVMKSYNGGCNTALSWLESDPKYHPFLFLMVPG